MSIGSISAIFPVFKPKSWTSFDVVNKVRKLLQSSLGGRIKVGHGGSLDPLAEGVLVVGVGRGTKVLGDYLGGGEKRYEGAMEMGLETTSGDKDGEPTLSDPSFSQSSPIKPYMIKLVGEMRKMVDLEFVGEISQEAPLYSSKKVY